MENFIPVTSLICGLIIGVTSTLLNINLILRSKNIIDASPITGAVLFGPDRGLIGFCIVSVISALLFGLKKLLICTYAFKMIPFGFYMASKKTD